MAPVQSFLEMSKSQKDTIIRAIKVGAEEKRRVYIPGAKACNQLYLGQYKHLFKENSVAAVDNAFLTVNTEVANKPMRLPMFQMADNVVAVYVQVYSPYLTQGEMIRTVTPTKPYAPPPAAYGIDPVPLQAIQQQNPQYVMQQQQAMMQMQIDQMMMQKDTELRGCRAEMLEILLNYFAKELNLREERKMVIDESLIVGGGVYMTELVTLPESNQKLVSSNFISMNDIVWDPDATRTKDCKWLAVQYRAPAWLVSRMFSIPIGDLKPNTTSSVGKSMADDININPHMKRDLGKDEVVFWKFWSRIGSGARLQPKESRNAMLDKVDEMLGDYCYYVVSECCDYPLNFGPQVFDEAMQAEQQAAQMQPQIDQAAMQMQMMGMPPEQIQQQVQQMTPTDSITLIKAACAWPIPYYMDVDDPWPITSLEYFKRPSSPYPVPPLEFCLSYINFMVWVICFVADKCYRSNRTIWLIDEGISDQLRESIIQGSDEAVVKMKDVGMGIIKEFIQFVDAPEIKASIFQVYEFFQTKFQQASGLTDLMMAQMAGGKERSATGAKISQDAATLRPQSMADQVYHIDTRLSRKEAIAAMYYLQGTDVAPIMGQPGGTAWQNLIMSKDMVELMRETQYDVVASPGRVLDLNTRAEQSNNMAQMVLPLLVNIGNATGMFGPANAILTEWAKSNQIDPALVQIPDMPPPQMQGQTKGVASPAKPAAKAA